LIPSKGSRTHEREVIINELTIVFDFFHEFKGYHKTKKQKSE